MVDPTHSPLSSSAVFHHFLSPNTTLPLPVSGFPVAVSGFGATPSQLSSPPLLERQVGNFVERTSGYGPNTDASIAEMNSRLVGNKRNNSDPTFMASPRESFPQMIPETSNVMKMLRSANGPLHGVRQLRPIPTSFMLQPTGNGSNLVKSDRVFPMNVGRASSQAHQAPLSRSKDGSSGPSALSQLAADEGSRTGRGSALFSSINASNAAPERNPSVMVLNGFKTNPTTHISVPEPSNPPSHSGRTSSTRQMTIIFGGQVHVFDDVHPNKADIIMELAGSSGGSWRTNLPKSLTAKTMHDLCSPITENEANLATDSPFSAISQGWIIAEDPGTSGKAVTTN